uniref:Uncharacterized protein n=1 Tax=Oryza glumipatula TaxID=40148 RepID=A0A0D9Y5U4_9ORYZ
MRWRPQVRGGDRVSASFGAEKVVAEEWGATAKPAVGAARQRRLGRRWHATGAHRREAEMGSGARSTGEDAGSSGNLGK